MDEREPSAGGRGARRELSVPVERIGRDGRRAAGGRLGILAVGLLAVGLVAVGVAGRAAEPARQPVPASPRPSLAPSSPNVSPTAPLSETPPLEAPALASEPLPGAPVLGLWRRSGDDALVLAWDAADPSAGVIERTRIVRLFAGIPSDAVALVARSPSGRLVLGSGLSAQAGENDTERLRVMTADGRLVWSSTVRDVLLTAPVWNPVHDELVIPTLHSWRIVSFDGGTTPVVRTATVPRYDLEPVGRLSPNPLVPSIVGFSPDGRTVYAAASEGPFDLGLRPLFALDLRTLEARTVRRLPARVADMTTAGGSGGPARIDPTSGRVLGRPGAGESQVSVYAPDGETPTRIPGGRRVLDAAWAGGGRLAILGSDAEAAAGDASATRIELVGPGRATSRVLMTTRLDEGTLVAAPRGYLLAVLGAGATYELALVRLRDGAVAALPLAPQALSSLRFLGWL
jgi:hypothetical protein